MVHKLSIGFLECTKDGILLKMLDMLTRNCTLLDLPLTKQDLLNNITTSSSLGYDLIQHCGV